MTRSGYVDGSDDTWQLIRWRGAVESALRGRRGQAFLREMLAALDALPEKRLVKDELVTEKGECCAIGSVALARGLDVSGVDQDDAEAVGAALGIAHAMAAEIESVNDDDFRYGAEETDEERFARVRKWVVRHIVPTEGEIS